jgi:hypothetical protein
MFEQAFLSGKLKTKAVNRKWRWSLKLKQGKGEGDDAE